MRRSTLLLPLSLTLGLAACGDDFPIYFPAVDVSADTGETGETEDASETDAGGTEDASETDAGETEDTEDTEDTGETGDTEDTEDTEDAEDASETDAGSCDDGDDDGVCDEEDICPDGDDTVDTDEDGVPDDCDVCADGPDDVDTDEDGTADACDICEGGDDNADADEDSLPDACDVCPESENGECASACSDSADTAFEGFADGVVGCSGAVRWNERDTLCGEGFYAATGAEWVSAHGDLAPTHHYWTDQDLRWDSSDDIGVCSVAPVEMFSHDGDCDAGPMRVCVSSDEPDSVDPLGNTCTWSRCGWLENEPQEYFGGCSFSDDGTGDEAGTLCIARTLETFDVAIVTEPPTLLENRSRRMRGNIYLADADVVLYGFDQRHESAEICDLDVYVWSTPSIEDIAWQTLYASTSTPGIVGVSYSGGASNMHINIEAGTYYALGVGWTCTAENVWSDVDASAPAGFGVTMEAFVWDNTYSGFDPDYLPYGILRGPDTYPQHITLYGLD